MESEELELAINELEVRLERLRALYEQYFLGFEKIEPTVARKDVDRRIYVLRREKIRNTARRFRLQNIIQRYNTFQQYWQRICREIENGTYKRHLLRAEKLAGPNALMTAAARRRFGNQRAKEATLPEPSPEALAAAALESVPPSRRSARPGSGSRSVPRNSRPPLDVGPRLPPTSASLSASALLSTSPRAPGMPPPPPKRPPAPSALPAGAKAASGNPAAPGPVSPTPAKAPGYGGPQRPPPKPAGSRPEAAPGTRPPPLARPVPPPRPASAGPAPGGDGRVRELHARLVAASRSAKRPAVSLESLEKTVRSTEASLRAKHPNRRIEFDIVLKDGKPVLKPIVR